MKVIEQFLQEASNISESKPEESCKAIVKNGSKILVIKRQTGKDNLQSNWDIPGGHMEKTDKNKEACLKREVFEEVGLEIKNIKFKITIPFQAPEHSINSIMNIYSAETVNGDVSITPNPESKKTEHTNVMWLEYKDELERLSMIDPLKDIVMKELKSR